MKSGTNISGNELYRVPVCSCALLTKCCQKMATTYHGAGTQSPTALSKPLERVFEDAQHTGEIQLCGRKLREYPKIAVKYDLVDTISTGRFVFVFDSSQQFSVPD